MVERDGERFRYRRSEDGDPLACRADLDGTSNEVYDATRRGDTGEEQQVQAVGADVPAHRAQ